MCSKNALAECKSDPLECLGPIALKALALAAGATVFVPLLAAFSLPFLG